MKKFLGHLKTVSAHRRMVFYHAKKVGIPIQGLFHDLSKYSPMEFFVGAKFYQGTKSPNDMERRVNGYSAAWMHHKGRNKHHFEYWTDYNPETRMYGPVKMPLRHVKEMFCDRVAASKIYQGKNYTNSHPYEYFEGGKSKRIIHKDTSDLIEKLLLMLRDEGEEATFNFIRNLEEY